MKMSGWVVEDDHVRLRDDSCVQIVSQLLEQNLKENIAMSTRAPPSHIPISKSTAILGCGDKSVRKRMRNDHDAGYSSG